MRYMKGEETMNTIQDLQAALKAKFLERSDLIDGLLVALIARETAFLLGKPGTAKSAVCEAICASIGGIYFQWLLSKFSTPDELFGAPSFQAFKEGRHERVTAGKLPEATVCFIDEIFKGSSAILNTFLPILNERKFFDAGVAKPVPLEVCYAASNEVPQSEELAALYDRLTLKYEVKPLSNGAAAELLGGNCLETPIPSLSAKELEKVRAAAAKVDVPKKIVNILVSIRKELNDNGIYVSDRKWLQIIKVLRAYAALNGVGTVSEDELEIIVHCCWHTPDQLKTCEKIVNKYGNPLSEICHKHRDAIDEVFDLLQKSKINPAEAHKKVLDSTKALRKLAEENKDNKKVAETSRYASNRLAVITKEYLGIDTSI